MLLEIRIGSDFKVCISSKPIRYDFLIRLDSFMNHTAIAGNLTQYTPDIKAIDDVDPSIKLLLGETNSDYVNLGMDQVEGVFGSSLWLADYLLYGMSQVRFFYFSLHDIKTHAYNMKNISRFNLIQGTNFGYAGWVPVHYNGQAPHVRPPLYGQILAADVIGHHQDVRIAPIDLGHWDLSAYAVYQSGILAKYVVINFDEWNTTTHYPRPSRKFDLHVPPKVRSAEIERLIGPGASSTTEISWRGVGWNWTEEDGRLGSSGKDKIEVIRTQGGILALEVPSTQAVVVNLV